MGDIEKIRNIGIIAHIDAGKTTTTERILYYTEKEHKMGNVDEGNTVMDYLEDERNRGITIVSAATTCIWNDYQINIIDTPGHVDFTVEVERSLRVLDGAIGIFCAVGGVEAQSETVWRQADKYHVPRIAFINKMDRTGASLTNVLDAIRTRLHANPVVLVMPWGKESDFQGIIDILKQKAYTYDTESLGKIITEYDIPTEYKEQAQQYKEQLIDTLAMYDEKIIEKYTEDALTEQDIKQSIRKATLANKITPVFTGASLRYKGVQPLLDAIIDYLPSPKDMPAIPAIQPNTGKTVHVKYNDDKLCAFVFKTTFDKHGELSYVRMYSGQLTEGMQVYNPTNKKTERVNRIWYMHANHRTKCETAEAGEIIGIVGLKEVMTGDTLCNKSHPIQLEKMEFPETVINKSIEPKTVADKDNLLDTLKIMAKDDPTFHYNYDEEHAQILISGMGELHLDIVCSRIQKEHNLKVNIGQPRVSYRETIIGTAEAEHLFQRQFGNKEHYAFVKVRVEPSDGKNLEIKNNLQKDQIPKQFIPSIEEGIKNAVTSGELGGYPLINIKVTILDAQDHVVNSTEEAFVAAAHHAVKEALEKAGYLLLEPIMKFQVQTPNTYMGDVISHIGSRRGEIQNVETHNDIQIISGKVPIAEMFGYADKLRSLTQGRGTYTMEPLEYAPVPEDIQKKVTQFY